MALQERAFLATENVKKMFDEKPDKQNLSYSKGRYFRFMCVFFTKKNLSLILYNLYQNRVVTASG